MAKARAKQSPWGKYKGALAAPISSGLEERAYLREVYRKLRLLCKHYDVKASAPSEKWGELAVALATAHVPGFAVRSLKKKGAPIKWDRTKLIWLFLKVELKMQERKHGASDAVRAIYKSGDTDGLKPGAMYRKYIEAKRLWGTGRDARLRAIEDWTRHLPRGAWAD